MFELRTFGGLEVRSESGEPVEELAGRTKALALLAYLAARAPDGRVPREEVAALLWPDRPAERARNALRVTLSRLRQVQDARLVGGEGAQHLWVDRNHLRADVTLFREALDAGQRERALDLYRGDFLAGVRVRSGSRFQRWADGRRSEYRRRAHEAALELGKERREDGELRSSEAAYRRALNLRPLREEAAARLIRVIAEQGRRADALQLYETFGQRLEDELDLSPSEELQELAERIRSGSRDWMKSTRGGSREPTEPGLAGGDGPARGAGPRTSLRKFVTRPRSLAAGLVVLLAVAAGGLWAWDALDRSGGGAERSDPDGDSGAGPTLAVLPFETIGAESTGPLAQGLHGDLLTRLAELPELDVIAQTSVETYRDSEKTVAGIARELSAEWVLEGTVHQAGDEIEVNAQLIDPRNDTHAWAETYRRELTAENLFELQRDLTRRIARSLETQLTSEENPPAGEPTTGSLAAHRFYIRGRSLLEQRTVPEMRRALEYFRQALAEDSSYALAWAGLADGMSVLARYAAADRDTLLPAASEAIERALALDPDVAEAYVARARLHMYRREGPAALRDFERAAELKPSLAVAHAWLGKLRLSLGRPEPALSSAERAVELDPMSRENLATLCWALLANGRGQRAVSVAHDVAGLEQGTNSYLSLVFSHLRQIENLRKLAPERNPPVQESPGYWFRRAAAGDSAAARKVLAEVDERRFPLPVIVAHVVLGQNDRAFERVQEAFPRKDVAWDFPFTVWLRYFWPETLDPLRDDPRYQQFLESVHVRWGLNPDGSLPDSYEVQSRHNPARTGP